MRRSYSYLLTLFFILAFSTAQAQIRAGFKISPGLGFINSSSLKDFYKNLEETSQEAGTSVSYNVSSRLRSHFTFGGFVEYKFSENIFFQSDPSITFSSNKIITVYEEDNVNESGNGSLTRITSDAKIRAPYIAIPILAKFRVNHRRELFLFAGLSFNFHFTPKLISEEEIINIQYEEGIGERQSKQEVNENLKLRSYNVFNLNTVFGAGKVFNRYGRNILVDIRYSLPITKSTLYANGGNENLLLNSVFTEEGRSAAVPRYSLADFKMGVLSLNIAYTLFKNYR